ncbi:AAA family ATPase [Allomuricauda sp. SCSIO 65647]|uniref:AAA family ATPase n=1 Tax=Allomuricauda sp. SCSIO 65647 TaxID=2908843 RepID=UPI001F305D9B|nr:ATP-binding protein [Muricauda sp. SCSIO 65647]UJH67091.1 ATP-binding protein [Muricauda sp. SCSIO 65647]
MGKRKIVVTGAPGTGKTSVIKGLEKKGFHCFHEVIRSMTAAARNDKDSKEQVSNPLVFVKDPLKFNKDLLHGRIEHFEASTRLPTKVCFFDRGIPDVLAYMDFFNQEYPVEFEKACEKKKYDAILILPPWKEIYTSDNERLESYKEAEDIHKHLFDTYRRFGYDPIIVPKTSVANRLYFVTKALKIN